MGQKRYTFDEKKPGKLLVTLGVFAVVVIFRTFIMDRVVVSGTSMNDTFTDGSVVWARKFNLHEIKRYDIVVAKVSGRLVIKRVVGLPDETLQMIDGFVYIDGNRLMDDYGGPAADSGEFGSNINLGENEFFLMGDNRNNSIDSRGWGSVQRADLKGICEFQIFPFNRIGPVQTDSE